MEWPDNIECVTERWCCLCQSKPVKYLCPGGMSNVSPWCRGMRVVQDMCPVCVSKIHNRIARNFGRSLRILAMWARCHGIIGTPNNWHPRSKYPRILDTPIPNFLRDFWHPLGFSVPSCLRRQKLIISVIVARRWKRGQKTKRMYTI